MPRLRRATIRGVTAPICSASLFFSGINVARSMAAQSRLSNLGGMLLVGATDGAPRAAILLQQHVGGIWTVGAGGIVRKMPRWRSRPTRPAPAGRRARSLPPYRRAETASDRRSCSRRSAFRSRHSAPSGTSRRSGKPSAPRRDPPPVPAASPRIAARCLRRAGLRITSQFGGSASTCVSSNGAYGACLKRMAISV